MYYIFFFLITDNSKKYYHLVQEDGTVSTLHSLSFPPTGGWQSWTFTSNITPNSTIPIDLKGQESGLYYVHIQNEIEEVWIKKWVKTF